jgi:hypothetical protein
MVLEKMPTSEELAKIQEEAQGVNEELDNMLAGGRYTKVQETADLIIKKRKLAEDFHQEWAKALQSLPEGKQPTMPLNEKAVANMYMAGHLFGKDFTMEHIAQCLTCGEEMTDQIDHPKEGSRYFKLDIPDGVGMPGRFVVPSEENTATAEHVANWNQNCEFKFRHGFLSPVIKKKDLPQWLVDLESVFYVIVERNEILDKEAKRFNPPKLQVADGSTESDPEGSWLISTVHYGQPSRRKPRPPREPKWDKIAKDPATFMAEMIKLQKAQSQYQKDYDSWSDEQRRVVFVDLEEEGVGQKGIKERENINDPQLAEVLNDNAALRNMLTKLQGEVKTLQSEMKGFKTKSQNRQ